MNRWSSVRAAFLWSVAAALPAQQNLFNVPSGVITESGHLFFQEQLNLGREAGTSSTTIDYGLGHGWEVGCNLLGLYLYDERDAVAAGAAAARAPGSPDLMLNLQKGLHCTDWWRLGVGAQIGSNIDLAREHSRLLDFTWVTNAFDVPQRPEFGTWYVGAYHANANFAADGTRSSLLLGVEIPIVENRLAFQADAILGRNDLGVWVVGGVYTFDNHWQLSLGAQFPNPGSGNPSGVVVEFTFPGFGIG